MEAKVYGKREALRVLALNHGLNSDVTIELGYSPSTGAVGCRWDPSKRFGVFNLNYPMHGRSDEVTDWVSVGCARPSKVRRINKRARA